MFFVFTQIFMGSDEDLMKMKTFTGFFNPRFCS